MIDTHCHIYYDVYSDDIDRIIENALSGGIEKMICVGVDLQSSEKCIELSEKYNCVYASVGYHPHDSKKAPPNYLVELESLSKHNKVVAIGEMGLDFHYNHSERDIQMQVFREQLDLSKSVSLPAIVHCREAEKDILKVIESFNKNLRGVIHCFSGNLEFARKIISNHFLISFTGMITFLDKPFSNVIKNIDIENIMLETDSPYLTPKPYRGKRNEPSYVKYIAEKISELKNIPINKVDEKTTRNATRLFNKILN